ALGAAEGVVALPHDRDPHLASSSCAAAYTGSTPSRVRHSLTLLTPQPSTPQGRQLCVVVTTRCSTFHGPHTTSLLGPNSATVGTPIAAARCMGIESTPMKSRERAISAPSSFSDSLPARLIGFDFILPGISSINPVSSGAEVIATR